MTQLLQNIFLQMASGLQTQTIYSVMILNPKSGIKEQLLY